MPNRALAWFGTTPGSVVSGAAVGVALMLFAVAVGALVFGSYGWGMFVVTPFAVGLTTGYLLNRRSDVGGRRTAYAVCLSTGLGALALVLVALEGVVCILMAMPLALPLAVLGGHVGRRWVQRTRRGTLNSFVGFAVLPMFFAIEQLTIGSSAFGSRSSIDIDATQDRVWSAIARMADIDETPSPAFRLGIGYPLGAMLSGEGVGALRYGVFSTGTAIERVTVWQPGSEIAFEVLSEPPAMRELSPYDKVHAPHVQGYFTTHHVRFLLEPLSPNRTRLMLQSHHGLKLEPRAYWLPFARWAIGENDDRVLRHIKRQSEQAR